MLIFLSAKAYKLDKSEIHDWFDFFINEITLQRTFQYLLCQFSLFWTFQGWWPWFQHKVAKSPQSCKPQKNKREINITNVHHELSFFKNIHDLRLFQSSHFWLDEKSLVGVRFCCEIVHIQIIKSSLRKSSVKFCSSRAKWREHYNLKDYIVQSWKRKRMELSKHRKFQTKIKTRKKLKIKKNKLIRQTFLLENWKCIKNWVLLLRSS